MERGNKSTKSHKAHFSERKLTVSLRYFPNVFAPALPTRFPSKLASPKGKDNRMCMHANPISQRLTLAIQEDEISEHWQVQHSHSLEFDYGLS